MPIIMITTSGEEVMRFNPGKEASLYIIENKELFTNITTNSYSIINSRINKVLHGKAKTAYRYIWKYV